jgi:hypothetical protein
LDEDERDRKAKRRQQGDDPASPPSLEGDQQ